MRIGRHCSTSGSLERAAIEAAGVGADALQIFSASPRMWRAKRPDPEQIRLFRARREKHDLRPLVIHDSYLINLAAPPSEGRTQSIAAFQGEIERALLIGADFLVAHPGNYKGLTEEQGMLNVAEALALAWRGVDDSLAKDAKLTILLENTAGAGAQLGGKLEELTIIRQLASPYVDLPLGYCIDTCHCYVAGWDLAAGTGFKALMTDLAAVLGLENIPVFHSNDAKMPLGSHLDRHANIGAGYIGLEGFRRLLNHPKLCEKAFILETPVDNPGDDKREIAALKELVFPRKRTISKRSSPNGANDGRKTRRSM